MLDELRLKSGCRRGGKRKDDEAGRETRKDKAGRGWTRRDEEERRGTRRDEKGRAETRRDEERRGETRRDETGREGTKRDEEGTRRDEDARDSDVCEISRCALTHSGPLSCVRVAYARLRSYTTIRSMCNRAATNACEASWYKGVNGIAREREDSSTLPTTLREVAAP